MTSATQARGTINRSPASGTSKLYSSSRSSDMGLPGDGAAAIDERFDGVEQLAFLVRLAQVVIDAELDGLCSMLLAHPRSDHHDRNILQARIIAHVRRDLIAVHARHLDVQQYDVRQILLQQRYGINAVFGSQYAHAVAFQQALRHPPHGDRVVHDQCKRAPVALIEDHGFRGARAPFRAHQRAHVQNQYDSSVAQNGGAGNAADRRYLRPQGFHDDFPAADQFVGNQRRGMFARSNQHHRHRHVQIRQTRRAQTDERAEMLKAVFLAAVFEQRRVLSQVPGHDISRQPDHAFHRRQRQRISLFRDAHDQRLADCQGERQANRESRSLAIGGIDEQPATQLLDFGGHYIHPDPAARRLRDMARRAEARLQYELHGFFVGEFRVGIDQSERNGFLADQLDVDPGAVVRHHDDDFRAVAFQTDRNSADVGLAE